VIITGWVRRGGTTAPAPQLAGQGPAGGAFHQRGRTA